LLAGCQQKDLTIVLDDPKPYGNGVIETTEYSVKKSKFENNIEVVIATGTLAFVLDTTQSSVSLAMDFSLTYNDLADTVDRGKTDMIVSSAEFSKTAMSPLKSHKAVALEARTGQTDKSYEFDGDYLNKTATLTNADKTTQSLSLEKYKGTPNIFDNEYLFYAVRSATQLTSGQQFKFGLSVLFDSFQNDAYTEYAMLASVAEGVAPIILDTNTNIEGIPQTEKGENAPLDARIVKLDISSGTPGPSLYLAYADKPIYVGAEGTPYVGDKQNDSDTGYQKVLLQASTTDTMSVMTYTLDKYRVS